MQRGNLTRSRVWNRTDLRAFSKVSWISDQPCARPRPDRAMWGEGIGGKGIMRYRSTGTRRLPRTARALLAACLLMHALADRVAAANLDFSAADFAIFSAKDGNQIGAVHYAVTAPGPGRALVSSLARYADGQYDIERDEFDTTGDGELPLMSAYEHTFYRSGGATFLSTKA